MLSFDELRVSIDDLRAHACPLSNSAFDIGASSNKSPSGALKAPAVVRREHIVRHTVHMKRNLSIREARRLRKQKLQEKHMPSPAILLDGAEQVPAGPLPVFMTADILTEAMRELPQGAQAATSKCVAAWRCGHIETHSLFEYARSIAWQSPALREGVARVEPKRPVEQECELLSDADFALLMGK
jgi:hypothetical protein